MDVKWKSYGTYCFDAGSIEEDLQKGYSASVTFTSYPRVFQDKNLSSIITISMYPVAYGEHDELPSCASGPYGLRQQVEKLVCIDPQDPGTTAQWADYEYDAVNYPAARDGFRTIAEAETLAVTLLSLQSPADINWSGKAPWE